MLHRITRNFSSVWAMISAPFRSTWSFIKKHFPERDITIMDTPSGQVYSYHQDSFSRFTKVCLTVGFSIWAVWSTYVYVYHRPLLQKRTQQLAELKVNHARQMTDMTAYVQKFNSLSHSLNLIDDRIMNSNRLSQSDKDSLLKQRSNILAELDFLQIKLSNYIIDSDYSPEFKTMSDLSVEYDVIRAENAGLKQQNEQMTNAMRSVSDADAQIVGAVSKLTTENLDNLNKNMRKINGTLSSIGISQTEMSQRANKFTNPLIGSAFVPLNIDGSLDPKYQRLADDLELWSGMSRMSSILPFGAPVANPRVTSTYGVRKDPFTGASKMHKGVDFGGDVGDELYAIAPGRVISAGDRFGYGSTVEIDHGLGFTTLYGHLSKINVKRGDWVKPGTVVGLAGSSGRSTGPHLHYEIKYKGAQFDPINFVKEK